MWKAIIKKVVAAAGYQIIPARSLRVGDDYAFNPIPRWGHDRRPHPQLMRLLEEGRSEYERTMRQLKVIAPILSGIEHDANPNRPSAPFWDNDFYQSLDAATLVGFLLSRRPERYLEIGSGHSTRFARHAIRSGALKTAITSIDPNPRAEIDAICDRVLRIPLEECDLTIFDELESGDLLFFDGSHRVLQNSDVVVFFLDIIPRLKPGILVHIHDIFLPADYPMSWNKFLFSEQYMLAAMLLCKSPPFRTILPNYFVCKDDKLRASAQEIFKEKDGSTMRAALFRGATTLAGTSFWIETQGEKVAI